MYRDMSVAELVGRLDTGDAPLVLDVRSAEEFADWSIPGAVNIPVTELAARLGELPDEREVVTVCASGIRSVAAAEQLARAGRRVASLSGGMVAWGGAWDAITIELDELRVVQVRRRGKGCLSYVVGAGDEAFVVDPSGDLERYRALADEHGWRITRIFDTHLHADHLSGARALAATTGASIHLNPADAFEFPFTPLAPGDRFELARHPDLALRPLSTPGHTRGSTVYVVAEQVALTGDVLFVESVGRPDLADRAEEFAHDLYRSLHDHVLALAPDTLVLPGHYGEQVRVHRDRPVGATLVSLLHSLDPLLLDEPTFVAWASGVQAPRPPNYETIVRANRGLLEVNDLGSLRALEIGPNRCARAVSEDVMGRQ